MSFRCLCGTPAIRARCFNGVGQLYIRVGFFQQRTHQFFRICIRPLTLVNLPHLPMTVNQVMRRPVPIVVVFPGGKVIVLCHRVMNVLLLRRSLHVGSLMFKAVFGGMQTNHLQPVVMVGVVQGGHMLVGALTVDAGVGPEIHQRDLFRWVHGLIRVQPTTEPCERWGNTTIVQFTWVGIATTVEAASTACRRPVAHCTQRFLHLAIVPEGSLCTSGPVGQGALDARRGVDSQGQCQNQHHRPCGTAHDRAVFLSSINALTDFVSRKRKHQQWRGCTKSKCYGEHHG